MNILVTGAMGQLGRELFKISEKRVDKDCNYFFYGRELDVTDRFALENFFVANDVSYVINCAAYTAVDKAESEAELAEKLNGAAPGYLAELSVKYNYFLIHISTDFVFDGLKPGFYNEHDSTSPLSVYGKTKLSGENKISKFAERSLIIRTSWLYSTFGNNFVKTIIRLAEERDTLGIVCDQLGTPTNAADLAEAIVEIISQIDNRQVRVNSNEIFHYSNQGVAGWYDFAKAIVEISGQKCEIMPIAAVDYKRAAATPQCSIMDKAKISQMFNLKIPYWRDSLKKCISILKS